MLRLPLFVALAAAGCATSRPDVPAASPSAPSAVETGAPAEAPVRIPLGEAVQIDGESVGEFSSASWSGAAGACIGLGFVRGVAAQQVHRGTPVVIDLWGITWPE